MIGAPCYGGLFTADFMTSVISLMQYAGKSGFSVHIRDLCLVPTR
jgi:hypothetical protein